jgi:glucose/arabinose dehydrogenase
LLAASAAVAADVTVVMSGLDNPRGLALGPDGALYVAEAGRGGAGPCYVSPAGSTTLCYGATGAITRLWRGEQERVVTGLPSTSSVMGAGAGPQDISFHGRGNAYVTIGWGADPALRSALGSVGQQFGHLIKVTPNGEWHDVADVSAFESAHNPAGGPADSNPYGALAEPGVQIVADAGANALLRVRSNGDITAIATFPSRPSRTTDSVPTSVALGPDGAYYVGELTGQPFAAGAANIYRVVPGEVPTVYLSGLTTVIDLAFGPDASLYVLQHSTGPVFFALPGSLLRIAPDGTRTTVLEGLNRPTSVAVGPDGTLYVTNNGISVGAGEVLQIED